LPQASSLTLFSCRMARYTLIRPTGWERFVGRISGTRHPAMGLAYGFGGRVPFTRRWGVSLISYAVNGTREAAALPLSIPAAPRGNRCCALRSPPACLTAAGSTRLTRPIHGTRPSGASASAVQNCSRQFCPCLGSPLSAIHGVQTLSFPLRFADFSGDTTPRCHIGDKSKDGVADTLPDGADAYPAYAVSAGSVLVGRIRHRRHPAIGDNAG
jgi:hypothetical protein